MVILAPENGQKLPGIDPIGGVRCTVPQQYYSGLRVSMPSSTRFSVASKRFIAADREGAILAGCAPTGPTAGGAGANTPGGGTTRPVAIPKPPVIPPPPTNGKVPPIPKMPPLPPPPLPPSGAPSAGPGTAAGGGGAAGGGILLLIGLALLASFGKR